MNQEAAQHVIIEMNDVCYGYEEEAVLLHISFHIKKGETIVLEGPNGCGKSTLMKMMNGLLFPMQGEMKVAGVLINKEMEKDQKQLKAFHQKIGYVFQNPDSMLFCSSVEDEIAFGPLQMGLTREQVKQRVEDCILLMNLGNFRNRAPYYLSTGEKKKVAIAAVLAVNPGIIMLDEPLAGLDESSQQFLESFLQQCKNAKKTMIIATHNHGFAKRIADRIVHIDQNHRLVNIEECK